MIELRWSGCKIKEAVYMQGYGASQKMIYKKTGVSKRRLKRAKAVLV